MCIKIASELTFDKTKLGECLRCCLGDTKEHALDLLLILLSLEHVCSIIASMLRNLKSQQRSRLLNKFTENDCEKVSFLYLPTFLFCPCAPPFFFFITPVFDCH